MQKFKKFSEAEAAAKLYFKEVWGLNADVGIESAFDKHVIFYSKADPAFDEKFECKIRDGNKYYCYHGGELKIE